MTMTCYTDWKYVQAGNYAKAKGLVKYIQFRDDREQHIPGAGGRERWVDQGLGGSWREIVDNAAELQSQKVFLRSLIIRPPQEHVAGLEKVDPERWADRRELLGELVERVMDAEMDRRGIDWPGGRQPLDLPYSYVIHTPDDKNGVESLHAHVIAPAMSRDRDRAFNVYPQDTQFTREVSEKEVERLFELERVRERQPELELEQEEELSLDEGMEGPDLEIPFFDFHGM